MQLVVLLLIFVVECHRDELQDVQQRTCWHVLLSEKGLGSLCNMVVMNRDVPFTQLIAYKQDTACTTNEYTEL